MINIGPAFYNFANWYWIVGGSTTQAFSSARSAYVDVTDEAYVAWLAFGNNPTRIDSEASLIEVLAAQAPNATVPNPAGLTAYAASARFNKETSGITVSGMSVTTDRQSQSMINGAYNMAVNNAAFTTQWKLNTSPPTFVTLNAATIITVALAVGAHVAACFAAEATIAAAINATSPTITSTAQIDAALAAVTA